MTLVSNLRSLKKHNKPQNNISKETKNKMETNKIENKNAMKTNKTKSWFFEKTEEKNLWEDGSGEKKENIQINDIIHEKSNITIVKTV